MAKNAPNSLTASVRQRPGLVIGGFLLLLFVIAAIFSDFLAPYDYREQSRREPEAPAATLHFRDFNGTFHLRPFVYRRVMIDPLQRTYIESADVSFPVKFFLEGAGYSFLGYRANTHLFGTGDPSKPDTPRIQLLGTDEIGRDRFSRILRAARFSLIVSPVGTILAAIAGILIGGFSGFGGRFVDGLIMRVTDTMLALPVLVLILAGRAAFPLELPPLRAAFLVILIFVCVGWAETARLTRGLVKSLRQREYVVAARSIGATRWRILSRHILPNAARPLSVQIILMLPVFLLTETALSFLGVGLQEPEPSWGNMLAAASDLSRLQAHPFLLLSPAVCIFLFVTAVRLVANAIEKPDRLSR